MRWAHVFKDSLRRKRATAKSAPNFSMAAEVAGGNCKRARAVLGMQLKEDRNGYFMHIYIYFQEFEPTNSSGLQTTKEPKAPLL
jgi:hypothetical protein